MIPAPGVTFSAIDSTNIVETGDQLSIWMSMSDGSLVAVYLPIAELIQRGSVIENGTRAPADAFLQELLDTLRSGLTVR
jgi:hypothetical protein